MSTPPSARRAATRERLVTAAIEVIARNGVLAASVEEICETAGFTRGAFYSNFDSKDELCVAILEARGQACLEAAREAVDRIDDQLELSQRIRHAVGLFMAASGTDTNSVLVMSELRLHAAREPAVREAFVAFERSIIPFFGELVLDGLESVGMRLTVPIDDALSLLRAVHDQTALELLTRGEAPDSPEVAELLSLVLRALMTTA